VVDALQKQDRRRSRAGEFRYATHRWSVAHRASAPPQTCYFSWESGFIRGLASAARASCPHKHASPDWIFGPELNLMAQSMSAFKRTCVPPFEPCMWNARYASARPVAEGKPEARHEWASTLASMQDNVSPMHTAVVRCELLKAMPPNSLISREGDYRAYRSRAIARAREAEAG
jgi:hypothetical protein